MPLRLMDHNSSHNTTTTTSTTTTHHHQSQHHHLNNSIIANHGSKHLPLSHQQQYQAVHHLPTHHHQSSTLPRASTTHTQPGGVMPSHHHNQMNHNMAALYGQQPQPPQTPVYHALNNQVNFTTSPTLLLLSPCHSWQMFNVFSFSFFTRYFKSFFLLFKNYLNSYVGIQSNYNFKGSIRPLIIQIHFLSLLVFLIEINIASHLLEVFGALNYVMCLLQYVFTVIATLIAVMCCRCPCKYYIYTGIIHLMLLSCSLICTCVA